MNSPRKEVSAPMPAKKKLSEKADKRYRAKITVPETGQKIYISARTRAELEQKKARVRAELIEGVAMHDMPFVEAIEEWFNVVKRPKIKAQSTLKNWLNALNLHVLPYFDRRKMCRAVRRADLQQCLDQLSGANTTTIQLTASILRGACHYALAERIITSDPSAALTLPKARDAERKKAFTPDQREALLRVAVQSPDGLMIYLLYYLGLRRGEMLGLQWGDIDWEAHTVRVQRDVDYNAGSSSTVVIGDLKTAAATRDVPIPDALYAILRPLKGLPTIHLVNVHGQPMNYNQFKHRWGKLMLAAGQAHLSDRYLARCDQRRRAGERVLAPNASYDYDLDVTPHMFRHNYITACVLAGIPAEVTMQIVGHTDYTTTIDVYTHVTQEAKAAAVQKVAATLASADIL